MTVAAIVLVLFAALAHATWNLLSKQASAAGAACFVWLMAAVGLLVSTPVLAADVALTAPRLSGTAWVFLAGTGVLHTGYFLFLQNGYRVGDLSIVYPVARGAGALLAAASGIVLFGEHPGPTGVAGIALIVTGIVVIGRPPRRERGAARGQGRPPAVAAFAFAAVTAVFIAGYTSWDFHAVSAVGVPPIVEDYASLAGITFLLAPVAIGDRPRLSVLWHRHRRQVLGAATLSPLSYILVLTAMRFTPVSAVAPAREVSVLFGVVLGGRLLGEGGVARRLAAAAAIVGGVVALTVG